MRPLEIIMSEQYRVEDDTVSFHVLDENEESVAHVGTKDAANKLAHLLNSQAATIEAQRQRIAELEAASQQMQEIMGLYAALPKDDTALSMLVPVLSKMAEFGANRQFHKITLGMLIEWTETALKITQRAKLAALVAEETPAAAPIADAPADTPPAPRFKVGDKVRSKSQRYEDGEYDVISRANGFGEFVLHGTYLTICFEGELEAYSESEGE
jgi:hypothetical protein